MIEPLSHFFQIHRRYHRSINLERDLGKPDAVAGYILTERSVATLGRILPTFITPQSHRAWTLTGVYGTGKSAFVHYLSSLCFPFDHPVRDRAMAIAQQFLSPEDPLWDCLANLPPSGIVLAVVTARQEPLTWTLVRGLARGADLFFPKKQRGSKLLRKLCEWESLVEIGKLSLEPQDILNILKDLLEKAHAPVLFVVDELGKSLEYAAQQTDQNDLYLLQQIAEFSLKGDHQVYFLGLLHQSFAGYSDRLSVTEQNEWTKIQGRFEDIPFSESPTQMLRLMGQVIDRKPAMILHETIKTIALQWTDVLREYMTDITSTLLKNVYPLHPLSALVLPLLCQRYAQNDRSLFTFLTSDEPHGFKAFLADHTVETEPIALPRLQLPTLQIDQLYDYFIETVPGLASRLNFQRWVEVKGLIEDARNESPSVIRLLKTIGVFNLIGTSGNLRATPSLIAWALCDRPDPHLFQSWLQQIDVLVQKTLITYRKQGDELRLWQGSDFDIEAAIVEAMDRNRIPLSQLLKILSPLKPIVAQRHYIQTGNLRYFEQRYGDATVALENIQCSHTNFDGLVLYWLDTIPLENPPAQTAEGKPLIVIQVENVKFLQARSRELDALKTIFTEAKPLQTDKVALREVRHRLVEAERLLEETIARVLGGGQGQNIFWVAGKSITLPHGRSFQARDFQSHLSDLCDRIYHRSLRLDNELINRRELSTQGTKARRELITAMIERGETSRLGFQGYGPEVTMYASVLEASGIHRCLTEDEWGFAPPWETSGLGEIWTVIEDFCTTAIDRVRSLAELYQILDNPPHGVKQGVIPVLLAAVLLYHRDDVGIYQDGTYIPVLGVEHFELLVRYPQRFAIKSFAIAGLRSQVFKELESILKSPGTKRSQRIRNSTLLTVVTPLYQFVKGLPRYTQQTQSLSPEAQGVLQVLQKTVEPDELLFVKLPQALGLDPIAPGANSAEQTTQAQDLRGRLVLVLREVQGAYDALLVDQKQLIYKAFGIRNEATQLREDLRVRSSYLIHQCVESTLRRFMLAAVDPIVDDRRWLESLLMIVADKPAEAWNDRDVTGFEIKLADLARRFQNLEALQKEVAARGDGFEARRITVTRPDGYEAHKMVWVDQHHLDRVHDRLEQMLSDLRDVDQQTQQALLIQLTERMLK